MTAQSFLLNGSLATGLAGLLLSPGAGLFAYSPLLGLLPFWLPDFWRAHRAEALTVAAIAASFLFLCGRFVFWHGLWSAPGPRYLFALTPLAALIATRGRIAAPRTEPARSRRAPLTAAGVRS